MFLLCYTLSCDISQQKSLFPLLHRWCVQCSVAIECQSYQKCSDLKRFAPPSSLSPSLHPSRKVVSVHILSFIQPFHD